jgi:Rho termination factor, N-terminal domain
MGRKAKDAKEKPLEKMTATELRDVAKEIDGITGVHGMNKAELVSAIKKSRGIGEKKRKSSGSVREIKKKIGTLRAAREKALAGDDRRLAAIYRRRISRLKKQTRQVA